MKRFVQLAIIAVFTFVGLTANAQKFGHVNTMELLSLMPERDSARVVLQNYSQMLQDEMGALQLEYQNKMKSFEEKKSTYSDLVRQSKETELQDLIRRIQEFQGSAQQDYQQHENELLQPIMEKAQNAISAVGEENGFLYIFDISTGSVVYNSSESVDVLPLVKTKLGIQ